MDVTKLADVQDGLYDLTVLVNGQKAAVVHIAQSANINALYITSDDPAAKGRDFVDASKSNIATGKLLVVDKDGKTVYDGALTQLKARGNTTFTNAEKKSYQIKLDGASPTSSPAARRSRPGRCSPAPTTQRSCATRCSRILPSRSAWPYTGQHRLGGSVLRRRVSRHIHRQ